HGDPQLSAALEREGLTGRVGVWPPDGRVGEAVVEVVGDRGEGRLAGLERAAAGGGQAAGVGDAAGGARRAHPVAGIEAARGRWNGPQRRRHAPPVLARRITDVTGRATRRLAAAPVGAEAGVARLPPPACRAQPERWRAASLQADGPSGAEGVVHAAGGARAAGAVAGEGRAAGSAGAPGGERGAAAGG